MGKIRLWILCCVLCLLLDFKYGEAKRGGSKVGGSRKSSGGSSWWSSGNTKSSSSGKKSSVVQSEPAPKPVAPHPEIKKQNTHLQQQPATNPNYNTQQQKPIGWNVPGNKQGNTFNKKNRSPSTTFYKSPTSSTWTVQSSRNKKRTSTQGFQTPASSIQRRLGTTKTQTILSKNIQSQTPPNSKNLAYHNHNKPRNNYNNTLKSYQSTHQQSHSYPTGNQPNTGYHPQQQGGWGNQHGGYGNQQSAWGGQHQGGWGNQHGGYGNQQHGSWGGHQNGGWGGGYSNQQGYSGYGGGYHSNGGMQRGGYGGGMGGYGMGMGGGSGMGMGGGYGGYSAFGAQRKSGFFSGGSTFGNILTGMAIYHVTSSLVRGVFGGEQKRPYNVYNYYNQPPEAREEIKLPSNVLSLCEGNLTTVCTGATAICTTNNTVLCIVTMSQASPCAEEKSMCINTTIPCVDNSDPICQNNTNEQKETTVNLPCYTNLSVDINLLNDPGAAKNGDDDYQYCVTTMAVAGPDYKSCSTESILKTYDYRNILAGEYTWNLTFIPMMRQYQSYNYDNPTQTPSGELVLPLTALIPCIENATKICPPDLVTICTGFGEIMCVKPLTDISICDESNSTCYKSLIECQQDIEEDFLCQNKTEDEFTIKEDKKYVTINMPCLGNVTLNTNIPNFDINTFNGTVPLTAPSSFTYNHYLCLITLSIPGPETDMCLVNGGGNVKT